MKPLRPILALCLGIVACASPAQVDIEPDEQNTKADGMATHLHMLDDHRVDVEEPSDLVYANGKFYTVSDAKSKIYEIDDDADIQRVIDIQGEDLEALAVDREGNFYVSDESRAKVWRLDSEGQRIETFEIDTTDGNSGIEGLTFDDRGHMLVAKEKHPARIIVINESDGTEKDRVKLDYADDISALTWNPADNHLYALSDEEHKLWRLDSDFNHITSWKLPIEHPEGLAFDGDLLYVVSDPEARMYVLQLD